MAAINYNSFCRQIASTDAISNQLYLLHLNTYERELPHVFLGEWTNSLLRQYRNDQRFALPAKACDLLNDVWISSDELLKNLIEASFLENIASERDVSARIAADLPRPLRDRLLRLSQSYD